MNSRLKQWLLLVSVLVLLGTPLSVLFAQKTVELSMPIPGFPSTLTLCNEVKGILKCDGIARYIVNAYQWLIGFTLILGVIALMFGGTIWILAGGSEKRITQAKGVIKNSFVGMLIALFSYLALWTISPNLVQFRPLTIPTVEKIDIQLEKFEDYTEEGYSVGDFEHIKFSKKAGKDIEDGKVDAKLLETIKLIDTPGTSLLVNTLVTGHEPKTKHEDGRGADIQGDPSDLVQAANVILNQEEGVKASQGRHVVTELFLGLPGAKGALLNTLKQDGEEKEDAVFVNQSEFQTKYQEVYNNHGGSRLHMHIGVRKTGVGKSSPITVEEKKTKSHDFTTNPGRCGVTNPPTKKTRIILHHSAGLDSASGCNAVRSYDNLCKTWDVVDCHYWVRTTGAVVGPCIPIGETSKFCAGGANEGSISIEIVDKKKQEFTHAQISAVANLIKQLSVQESIPLKNDTSNLAAGVFSHANLCALVPNSPSQKKNKIDIAENIFEAILKEAGGTYLPNQPRCGSQSGTIK